MAEELVRYRDVTPLLTQRITPQEFIIDADQRGRVKQTLIKVGCPIEDLAGLSQKELQIRLVLAI